jgi:hypothetical protein
MEFKFSIRNAVREAWDLFKKHAWFFLAISAVTVVMNLIGGGKNIPFPVTIILMIATFIWSIVVMKISLAAADNKEELLSFSKLQSILPSFNQILGMLGVAILMGLLIICGLILLIIPGIWVAIRLSVSNLAYIDKGEGVRKALRSSWNMTKGPIFWTAVLVGLTSFFLYIVGLILFGIGILVTYPLAMILLAKFYRALTVHHGFVHTIVPQPAEIVAPAPEVHHEGETHSQ